MIGLSMNHWGSNDECRIKIRALFQYTDHLSWHRDCHYKDKVVWWPPHLYNGNPYAAKMTSLYWAASQILKLTTDTPYLTSTSNLWDVYCGYFGENWLCTKITIQYILVSYSYANFHSCQYSSYMIFLHNRITEACACILQTAFNTSA